MRVVGDTLAKRDTSALLQCDCKAPHCCASYSRCVCSISILHRTKAGQCVDVVENAATAMDTSVAAITEMSPNKEPATSKQPAADSNGDITVRKTPPVSPDGKSTFHCELAQKQHAKLGSTKKPVSDVEASLVDEIMDAMEEKAIGLKLAANSPKNSVNPRRSSAVDSSDTKANLAAGESASPSVTKTPEYSRSLSETAFKPAGKARLTSPPPATKPNKNFVKAQSVKIPQRQGIKRVHLYPLLPLLLALT